jgi:uridine kinase
VITAAEADDQRTNREPAMVDIRTAVEMILAGRQRIPAHESMLVAVSGIDGSGKGYVTDQIVVRLQQKGVNAVAVNVAGWFNLPSKRFHKKRPAEHFYRHAIHF